MTEKKKFLIASAYVAGLGLLSNLAAKDIKITWKADRFPFALWPWEKDGKLFRALRVRKWKDRVPDMSKILPFLPNLFFLLQALLRMTFQAEGKLAFIQIRLQSHKIRILRFLFRLPCLDKADIGHGERRSHIPEVLHDFLTETLML